MHDARDDTPPRRGPRLSPEAIARLRAVERANAESVDRWVSTNKIASSTTAPGPVCSPSAATNPAYEATWIDRLPPYIVFIDTETTGLKNTDQIVSLAAIRLTTEALHKSELELSFLHLLFDPGINSHLEAGRIHGYSDWQLRHQDIFSEHAEEIWKFIHRAPVIVGHNVEFDIGYLNRAFSRSRCPPISRPWLCTMGEYRRRSFPGRATLAAACQSMGIARRGANHGALEDAWLCMLLYLSMQGSKLRFSPPDAICALPTNIKPSPPLPIGKLPRRKSVWPRG